MNKLRVGVWVNSGMSQELGGGFTYYSELFSNLKTYAFSNADIVFLSDQHCPDVSLDAQIKWRPSRIIKLLKRCFSILRFVPFLNRISAVFNAMDRKHLQKLTNELYQYVDVIYYLIPQCVYPSYPYIYTLWDLGHLSTFAFPEVTQNGQFDIRNSTHQVIQFKALMIFVESYAGKQDVIQYLRINPDRIKVVPIFPSGIINTHIKAVKPTALDEEGLFFIHYPAQYWAHKNHFNLLLAFKDIIEEFPNLRLVLTGSDHGNKKYISAVIVKLGLSNSVIDLGFVSNEELKWLYLNSKGLVMPTFLGPTNMPLMEAGCLNCPVACSDFPGHREQLGEYGNYFDPKDPNDIARKIKNMIHDGLNNKKIVYLNKFNIHSSLSAIDDAFDEIYHIRSCWGNSDESY